MRALVVLILCLAGCGDASSDGAPASNNGATNNGDTNNGATNNGATNNGECPGVECGRGTLLDAGSCECVLDEMADLDAVEEDFECLLSWDRIRRFRITNKLGRMDEALAVANNPEGGTFPVGTIIQLVPQEAMVKRRAGFSPATQDWEFFFLGASAEGTEIRARGTTEVVNAFGGNCFECHAKAEPQWDLLCEQDNGCDPLPIGEDLINNLQDNDPRCP